MSNQIRFNIGNFQKQGQKQGQNQLFASKHISKPSNAGVYSNAGTYRKAGHLADQQLKYNYPKQPTLFEPISDEAKKDIEDAGISVVTVIEGINLEASETKLIDAICKLLHEKSQNSTNSTKENYYTGNGVPRLMKYIDDETTHAPQLHFSLYEIAKAYNCGKAVSGKGMENVNALLEQLAKKQFLMRYTETRTNKAGEWVKKAYEGFRTLIKFDTATISTGKGEVQLTKQVEKVIILHPIFRSQIGTKFLLYPNDIGRRTVSAYGSHNVSQATLRLRDYLIRELSSKHYNPQICVDKLYYLLNERLMKERKKKKVQSQMQKALEVVTKIGLLESYIIEPSKGTGEPKIIFTLNKKFE